MKRNNMLKNIFITAIMVLNAQFVNAGSQTGKILNLNARSDGLHWIILEGTHSNKPACAAQNYWMIKDENSASGKTQISILLAAYATGKSISIDGLNTCTRWFDGEDINVISAAQ